MLLGYTEVPQLNRSKATDDRSACGVRWAQSIGGVAVQDVQRLADCGDVAGGTG